ncbi:LysO family transporter [Clostridium peptidivorans]|uniref:LysO family transporter n=1 Tax=Clostridium peptidivorans TaxID=100174 RepID=UPI000BE39CCE|nr:LysO family transporter [Clostridium peptidivorans]
MWKILLSLVVGAAIGYFFNLSNKQKKINSKIQQFAVVFLLFSMGISVGANKSVIANLKNIGTTALTFAILTSLFSIIFVFVVTNKFMKGSDS